MASQSDFESRAAGSHHPLPLKTPLPDGVQYYPGYFDPAAQQDLLNLLRTIITQAPLFTPTMPKTGKAFSVRMSNCGSLGWVSDLSGYRYQAHHPETGAAWPAMPEILHKLWQDLSGFHAPAEACLINYYSDTARMGLHQDRDEQTFAAPVVSVSLGDEAVFRIGGINRKDPTRSLRLHSGDVLVFGGPARLAFHGIDRLIKGSSPLLKQGGRINLTLRRVTEAT
jgi:DNA oxidative demethylase